MTSMFQSAFVRFSALCLVGALTQHSLGEDASAQPHPGLKTKAVTVQWEYSTDGGKTWGAVPPAGAAPNNDKGIAPIGFRGTFEVADPQGVAGLFVRLVVEPPNAAGQQPSICTGDLVAASGGYWKDLGFCPTLLNSKALVNGKHVTSTVGPMLYIWFPLEGLIAKGKNTLELTGDCYTYWGSQAAKAVRAELVAAEPQPARICAGPVLGDFGDGYFTVTCRTTIPADVTVEATPTEPAGKSASVTSTLKTWHRRKVPVPAGTKAVSYTLKSKVGAHESSSGPHTVTFPGKEFRFVALGNILAHQIMVDRLKMMSDQIVAMKPALIVNTGNVSEHGSWDFDWETRFFGPAGKLVATVPTLMSPGGRDFAGVVNEMHYTPAADGYGHNWSKAVGPVRFIGINGNQLWEPGSQDAKWLEGELAGAKEKFLFVLDAQPAYSSGKNSRHLHAWQLHARNNVMPLLGKYKAHAMLSGNDPDYERSEPTPDVGCTQLVIGSSGKDAYRFGRGSAHNPFFKGKGHDWAGAEQTRAICVFDVKEKEVEMRCLALPAEADATEQQMRVLDTKKFAPRQ